VPRLLGIDAGRRLACANHPLEAAFAVTRQFEAA
jgi:hypothetical protein